MLPTKHRCLNWIRFDQIFINRRSCVQLAPWMLMFQLRHDIACLYIIEAETEWAPVWRRHFQMHFLQSKLYAYTIFTEVYSLTHWGRVTHICVSKLTIIGSDNGLSPGRRQAIIWTNAGILSIGHLGTNFNEILIEIQILSSKEMRLKMSSAKWRLFSLGLNELRSKQQSANIRSDNGLVTVRRYIIIWINDGSLYWRIYASLGLDEFISHAVIKL